MSKPPSAEPPTARLGDHPVLDLLNTELLVDGALRDVWQSDEDVVAWLRGAGMVPVAGAATRGLLASARQLRATVRALVAARKLGKKVELEPLNSFLLKVPSALQLEASKQGKLVLTRQRRLQGAEQALAPLAELAAELIANGDFELIRECESDECVLWFYDRTKSHRRRWCSMAACGNRHKVAAFRERVRNE